MAGHYIVRKDGVVQRYFFKDEKKFRRKYEKSVPHRPRWAERKFKKRIRIYREKDVFSYRTMYVVNAKGSGVGAQAGTWSFTVDAEVYTPSPIDDERYNCLADLPEVLAEWLINEFGFRNVERPFNVVGSMYNAKYPREDGEERGFFIVNLDVEDVTMVQGDYRFRRNLKRVNACMLAKSCKRESYSIRDCKVVPRVASKLCMCR